MKTLFALALLLAAAIAAPGVAAPLEPAGRPPNAEDIYAAARPRLLQIRTVVEAAGRQASLGSGFLVSRDGLAITNYHVVSQFALEPKTYRLEYVMANGDTGKLTLLALDVANDLALVRLDDRTDTPFFTFSDSAVSGAMPKGEHLYSMGNPLDLGFTIVDGTYNGNVERTYNQRIHFSGALNPGMSGGPTVTSDGTVAGINVARELGGELVSFLVPAKFAAALLARESEGSDPPADFTAEIGRQFEAWQSGLYKSFDELGFRPVTLGRYEAPESAAPWFSCWGRTNSDDVPKPRASINASLCNSDTQIFIANDLNTGLIHVFHTYVKSDRLNPFQFSAFLAEQITPGFSGGYSRKWQTQQRCSEGFVQAAPRASRPTLRTVWCARAYREFPGLYDVTLTAVTQDSGHDALVSQLAMQGVVYANAMALGKHFIEAVQWTK